MLIVHLCYDILILSKIITKNKFILLFILLQMNEKHARKEV